MLGTNPIIRRSQAPKEGQCKARTSDGGSGATYDDIVALLYIRKSTLKTHVAHIRRKLGVSPREDLGAAYRRLMLG